MPTFSRGNYQPSESLGNHRFTLCFGRRRFVIKSFSSSMVPLVALSATTLIMIVYQSAASGRLLGADLFLMIGSCVRGEPWRTLL